MTDETVTASLEELVGEHALTGVSFGTLPPDPDTYRYENAETISFVLDDRVFTAVQDPGDGYRSSMEKLLVGGTVSNMFPACRVVCSMRTKGEYGHVDEVLEMRDVQTGKLVLEVGTSNTDDYYPCWEGRFDPTGMASNS